MAARDDLLHAERDGQRVESNPISTAQAYVLGHASLMPDLFDTADESILSSICQFDALACVTAVCATPDVTGSQFYPNFARFDPERTEPALVRLVIVPEIRAILAPVDDSLLSSALEEVSRVARGEGRNFDGWWGFQSQAILDFMASAQSE
jgi:hypothetical protein